MSFFKCRAKPTRLAKVTDQNVWKDPKHYVKVCRTKMVQVKGNKCLYALTKKSELSPLSNIFPRLISEISESTLRWICTA